MIMSNRFRGFFVRTYLNELTLINLLNKNLNSIARFCFAKHDKDIFDDGKPKEPHIHLVIRFKEQKSIKVVKEFFPTHNDDEDSEQSSRVEVLKDERIAVRYLLHKDTPDKFQYDSSIIFNHGCYIDTFLNDDLKIDKCDTTILALSDLLSGMSLRDCALKYGRDFIIHYTQYRCLLQDINLQDKYNFVDYDAEINEIDKWSDFKKADFDKLPTIKQLKM